VRATLDKNVLISYLLAPESNRPPSRIVRAGLTGDFDLVLALTTMDELRIKTATKPYLVANIPSVRRNLLIDILPQIAEIVAISSPIPRVVRDDRDDYMLAPEVLEAVDYVVSGDKDLLVLGEHAGVRIISPAAFVAILDGSSPTMEPR
jgi:predicted nucleic acid-binding protein